VIVPHSRPLITKEDIRAVVQVLSSGQIAQGKKVQEFEAKMASFVGSKYAVAVSSGTAALHLALLGMGIGSGDEVILPSYVCSSPYLAILYTGATPTIADISPADFNICEETARPKITLRTKAIIVPHMFGMPADISGLRDLGVPVIEDCAQALGATYQGKRVGSLGVSSIFSFYATKMVAAGEGGMILTNDRRIYHRVLGLRDYDKKPLDVLRFNYKMTDLQAALGIAQFKRLGAFIKRRKEIASRYSREFARCDVQLPQAFSHKKSAYYRYVVRLKDKARVQRESKRRGIMCENPVWKPLHRTLGQGEVPNSDYAFRHALSIPIYPALPGPQIKAVSTILGGLLKKTR
jgi:perosamine synthetase